jgi:hypothetical protein
LLISKVIVLIAFMLQNSDTKLLLAAVRAVHKVCVHIINTGDLRSDKKSALAAGDGGDSKTVLNALIAQLLFRLY